VTARSKAWVRGSLLAGIVGSNPSRGIGVCCECCVLGRGLCDGPITCPEESYIMYVSLNVILKPH
jgi:hypothetical protein